MSASGLSSVSGEKPWLAVMAEMRMVPRSGQMICEPDSRKCGMTTRRSSCSSESLVRAKTIQLGCVPGCFAPTSMRRTMPSAPGAVDTWIRSPWPLKRSTARVRSMALLSTGTRTDSIAPAGPVPIATRPRTNTSASRKGR